MSVDGRSRSQISWSWCCCVLVILATAANRVESNSNDAAKNVNRPKKQPSYRYDPPPNEEYANYMARMRQVIQLVKENPELLEPVEYDEPAQHSDLDGKDIYVPWICPSLAASATPPTTAHVVRPGDIKVIGALGDSITAANGVRAETLPQVAFMNRGESWSIGGERSLEDYVLTLPNILRKYNPNITGSSVCRQGASHEWSGLNVAIPGDTNRGMAAQAEELMLLMLEDPNIDYWNDWKLVTIFIGGNDLCQFCVSYDRYSSEAYYNGVKAALDLFYKHMPRGIINLQPMFDVSVVSQLNHNRTDFPRLCPALHRIYCPCIQYGAMQRDMQLEYFAKLELLADGRYDARSDFTVVLQPHTKDLVPVKNPDGTYDMSFVAPDCFHPSHKAHQMFAYMLWNVMLTPVGLKTTNYSASIGEKMEYICPTEAKPYIYTNCNSEKPEACGLNSQTLMSGVDHVTSGPLSVLVTSSMLAVVIVQLRWILTSSLL